MTLTGPTARPIRFTADLPAWRSVLEALGGVLIHEATGWVVYQLGSGRVALHRGDGDEGEGPGVSTFCVETPEPLEEAVARVRAAGVPIDLEETGHGTAGVVRAADGTLVTLDAPTPGEGVAPEPRLAVLPIWYAADVSLPRAVLESLGLPTRYRPDAFPALHETMRIDKKARGTRIRFIVLDGLARPVAVDEPDPAVLVAAYAEVS